MWHINMNRSRKKIIGRITVTWHYYQLCFLVCYCVYMSLWGRSSYILVYGDVRGFCARPTNVDGAYRVTLVRLYVRPNYVVKFCV